MAQANKKRTGDWMLTASGRQYWPHDPRAEDVLIDDIAHHLSMLCRYTGAVRRFYSVAEHSIHVSKMVPREHALCGLLHDATEAYIADLNRPTKVALKDYKALEELNWMAVAEAFNLPVEIPACVHQADVDMLFLEKAQLLPHAGPSWGMGLKPSDPLPEVGPLGMSTTLARQMFWARYNELTES